MKHYRYFVNPVNLISIKRILLTQPLVDAIKKLNKSFNFKAGSSNIIIKERFTSPLKRLNKMRRAFYQNKKLPPVVVKRFNDTDKFRIIDGRHRFVTSIIGKYSHIPVIII